MLTPRIGCYAVYEKTEEGWENAAEQMKSVCRDLRMAGLDAVEAPESVVDEASCKRVAEWFAGKDIDLLHPLIVTWSFDHFTFMIWQKVRVPVAIRTIPGIRTGSVVGGQQLGCVLTDLEIEHRLFYGPLGNVKTSDETAVYARACSLKKSLAGAKFAMLGRRTPGMTPIVFDELRIMHLFGSLVATMGMNEVDEYTEKISLKEAETEWKRISSKANTVICTYENGVAATRNYLAFKSLAKERGFDAITVGSYPDCQGTACLAISLLNDESIVTGCEGDMNSTIAMYILNKLCGTPVHFGEMLDIDETENTIISSHCGAAAISLADGKGHVLCPVRLANNGVCVRFSSKTGPVTYVNLVGGKDGYRMCAFEGEAMPTGMVFEGNPMKIRLKAPFRRIWDKISEYGFCHHWMAVYEHVVPELSEFCRITGIKGIFPDHP